MMEDNGLIADIEWLRDRAFMTEKGGYELVFERIAKRLESLNAECERAWGAYRIAHGQAMQNGSALAEARAQGIEARQGQDREAGPDPKGESPPARPPKAGTPNPNPIRRLIDG